MSDAWDDPTIGERDLETLLRDPDAARALIMSTHGRDRERLEEMSMRLTPFKEYPKPDAPPPLTPEDFAWRAEVQARADKLPGDGFERELVQISHAITKRVRARKHIAMLRQLAGLTTAPDDFRPRLCVLRDQYVKALFNERMRSGEVSERRRSNFEAQFPQIITHINQRGRPEKLRASEAAYAASPGRNAKRNLRWEVIYEGARDIWKAHVKPTRPKGRPRTQIDDGPLFQPNFRHSRAAEEQDFEPQNADAKFLVEIFNLIEPFNAKRDVRTVKAKARLAADQNRDRVRSRPKRPRYKTRTKLPRMPD